MCHVNLEVYQAQVNHEFGTDLSIPVMYFTQLMGMAMGLQTKRLGIEKSTIAGMPMLAFA